ncbi:MAG: hypothetical protein H6658_00480 [Ardenticatenaceae bacterium]|nr:hypothetical protein [Ardenticatenaceae bacterium]
MAEINLLEFFKTGQFGPVKIGTTRSEVKALLGMPDNQTSPNLWEYGGVELHFDPTTSPNPDTHALIQITFKPVYLAVPEKWQTDIIPWVFGSYFGPTQQELKKALMQAAISYTDYKQPPTSGKENGRYPKSNWLYSASHEISGTLYLPSGVSASYGKDDLIINVELSQ